MFAGDDCSSFVCDRRGGTLAVARSSIFIGCHDEGHDREPEQQRADIERARAAFDAFNQTNDPASLNALKPTLGRYAVIDDRTPRKKLRAISILMTQSAY